MIKKLFSILFLAIICLACSKEVSWSEYSSILYDEENGLSKKFELEGTIHTLTLWPAELVSKKKISPDFPILFELKSSDAEVLFRLSEMNFKIKDGSKESYASIAFAENLGSPERNHLLIGFPKTFLKKNMTISMLNSRGDALKTFHFELKDLQKIENLKINR